ncbi:MAG: MATE family efflux transporter [Saprospiraceae bacterium]
MSNQTLRQEIRTNSMWQLMLKLTPVAVLAMSVNSLNTFVDALFIGQFLGETALAAVSLAFPLSFLANSFAAMLGVGGSSMLSIAIGAKDTEKQKKIFGTIAVLAVIVSFFLSLFGWIFAEEMVRAIGGEGEVLILAVKYYRVLVLGSFFQIFAVSVNFLIRAEGKIKAAMRIAMVSMGINMVLNPLFIGYFELGIAGAAYATIIAMAIFVTLDIAYFVTGKASYAVDLTYFKLDKNFVKPILTVGISAMMLQLMFVVQQVVVFKTIAIYGDDWDIAFMGACYRIMILILVPGFGFSSAMQPVAGINFGAKDYNRVKKSFWIFAIGSTTLTSILLLICEIFPTAILSLMLPTATFTATDILNFRLMMSPGFVFSFFFMGIVLFQSIGNAKIAGIVMILRDIFFFIPFVILLPRWFGITGIYSATIFQNAIVILIAIYLIYQLFKKWDLEVNASKITR